VKIQYTGYKMLKIGININKKAPVCAGAMLGSSMDRAVPRRMGQVGGSIPPLATMLCCSIKWIKSTLIPLRYIFRAAQPCGMQVRILPYITCFILKNEWQRYSNTAR
jgi:hypothetical protein